MKKALVLILALILAVAGMLSLSSCELEDLLGSATKFEISFVVDGQVYDTVKTSGNETISMPENPTKEGYTFDGWYWDEGSWEKPFTENSLLDAPIQQSISLYAKWQTVTEPTPDDNTQGGNNGGTTAPDTHVHSLAHTEKVEASCTTDGNIEYWHCSGCDKNYSDANAENEVSSVVISGGHAASASSTVCTRCGLVSFDGLVFTLLNDSTCAVTDYIGSASSVVIPVTYENTLVTSIGEGAFDGCSSLMSITIPNSVASIGDSVFENCNSLTSITIPSSVTSIGDYAFSSCDKLVEVYNLSSLDITKGGKSYGYAGYYALDIYTSATATSKLHTTSDGYIFYVNGDTVYLFGYTGNNATLTLPENYNGKNYAIYQLAFYKNYKITNVTIPSGVTAIGRDAFCSCGSLESITISNSVTSIGDHAFYDCTSLTSVTIGSGVTSIGSFAFNQCTSLTNVTIGSGVTSIGYSAFYSCTSLTSITIPSSVTSIGPWAFYYCTALTEINFNATAMNDLSFLNIVFSYAGQSGSGIKVTIGKNVTKIPAYLFYPCDGGDESPKITSVEFEEGSVCTSIGYKAFCNCTSLTSVTFENKSGWWYSSSSDATSGTSFSSDDLENTSTAATYLKSTYADYYWKRG
ncbi:MAG: leucine-rich repeat protein [Clostridia bacterium]|nr:leucine-rich repeat protein [Clostridia bacterium]